MKRPSARIMVRAAIIALEISSETGLSESEILHSRRRTAPLVGAREMLAKRLSAEGFTSVEIGRLLGRHHSTILHALNRVEKNKVRKLQYAEKWGRP